MGRGPHWLLSEQEAQIYGAALANALRHLPVAVGQKYIDFTALGVAMVTIDGARLRQDILLRRRQAPAGAENTRPANLQANGANPLPAAPAAPAEHHPAVLQPLGPIRPDFDA